MVIKQAPVAPIWTRIGVPCIVFREESEYGTPGAQFATKTTKNSKTFFRKNHIVYVDVDVDVDIYTEDGEWVTDESFEVKCVMDE